MVVDNQMAMLNWKAGLKGEEMEGDKIIKCEKCGTEQKTKQEFSKTATCITCGLVGIVSNRFFGLPSLETPR